MTPHSTDRCALCNQQLANHTSENRHCPLPGRAGIRSYSRTAVFTPKQPPTTPPLPLPQPPPPPVSKSRGAKRRGRPRKPKRDHSVTLTLTLPNAAHRRHLKRLAKAAGHKTPGAFIVASFPVPAPPSTIKNPQSSIE